MGAPSIHWSRNSVQVRSSKNTVTRRVSLRHVGVVLSDFSPAGSEARLFEPPARSRRRSLYAAIDSIRDRWGHAAVVTGRSIELLGHMQQNDYGFVLRTPSLTK